MLKALKAYISSDPPCNSGLILIIPTCFPAVQMCYGHITFVEKKHNLHDIILDQTKLFRVPLGIILDIGYLSTKRN